jgi:hypothetical protein
MFKKCFVFFVLMFGLTAGTFAMGKHPSHADDSDFDAKAEGKPRPPITDVKEQSVKPAEPITKTPEEIENENAKSLANDPFFGISDKEKAAAAARRSR